MFGVLKLVQSVPQCLWDLMFVAEEHNAFSVMGRNDLLLLTSLVLPV